MGRRPIQESTYLPDDESEQLEAAADNSDMSKAEILREGLRRQLAHMVVDDD